jgi:hypothetical protein
MHKIDVCKCTKEAHDRWAQGRLLEAPCQVREVPDSEHLGFKLKKYLQWFSYGANMDAKQRYIYHLFDQDLVQTMARFRMGAHWLNAECMRKGADGKVVARSNRLCPCCLSGAREDELHVLECPYYQDIRLRYNGLFPVYEDGVVTDDEGMNKLMNGDGSRRFWNKLAHFLLACKRSREKVVVPRHTVDT